MFRPCCLFLLIIRQEEHTAYVGLRVCGYFRERPEFEFLEAELEVGTEAVSFLESPVRKGELKSAWVWDKAEPRILEGSVSSGSTGHSQQQWVPT